MRKLDLSEWDVSNVTNTSDVFRECVCLETVDATGWNLSKNLYMTNMFYNCRKLVSVEGISEWGISAVTAM